MENSSENTGENNQVNNEELENSQAKAEKIFSQEELNEKIQARVAREDKKLEALQKEFDEFKNSVSMNGDSEKALTDLKAEKDSISAERDKLSLEIMRLNVAIENSLSEDALALLSGNDEAELKANAERIKKLSSVSSNLNFKPKDYQRTSSTGNIASALENIKYKG